MTTAMRTLFSLIAGIVLATIAIATFAKRVVDRNAGANGSAASPAAVGVPSEPAVPVIVELFTSEGCSSCPPADALLAKLENEQSIPGADVLALEEHVDYWNDLGWTDPFSSRELTARQQRYAQAFRQGSSYTPQMVVGGQFQFVGSRSDEARKNIAAAASRATAQVTISRASNDVRGDVDRHVDGRTNWNVSVRGLPATSGDAAEVWLAVTETSLHSNVQAGENAGRDLGHAAVVRQLIKLGVADGRKEDAFAGSATINIHANWKKENLRVVAFVQEKNSRHILGAGSAKVSA
jgi:hypothetical protein